MYLTNPEKRQLRQAHLDVRSVEHDVRYWVQHTNPSQRDESYTQKQIKLETAKHTIDRMENVRRKRKRNDTHPGDNNYVIN